jgi:DNA-binding SARP family transcriptional activator
MTTATRDSPQLSVTLLGTPTLALDLRPLGVLRRKNRALLYYLAAQAEPLTRDQILTVFWPDHERAAAQRILRTMLSEMRKQLGANLLSGDTRLMLAPDSVVDVRLFEAGVARRGAHVAELTATLEMYRGDFLDGFKLTEPPEFDDWVTAQREYYRLLAIRALSTLAQLHEAQRDYGAALNALIRALSFNPLQEDLQRTCLRLHYLSGDRAGAIRRYETLRQLLADEMGVPPMPETRALYDAIISDTPPAGAQLLAALPPSAELPVRLVAGRPPSPAISALPFTGRTAELETLRSLCTSNKLIMIEGEPGIGKTRLVEEFTAAHAAAAQTEIRKATIILRGAAHELEQGLPYQPFMDALRGLLSAPQWPTVRASLDLAPVWLAEVARLIPEIQIGMPGLSPASPIADESRLWEGLNQLLQMVSRRCRLVLFLDDLHWADASTVSLLGYLVRRAASADTLFVGTQRPTEASSRLALLMQALTREERLARLVLLPLTLDDTNTLAAQLSSVHPDALSAWLTRSAEGNPFFLTELVRYAYVNGLLRRDGALDPQVLASAVVLPQSIHNLIQSRLTHLSQPARNVLELAAVVGQEFDFELVAHSTGLSESAELDALDELMAAALIQPRGGERFAFDHNLTMEVIDRAMSEMRKRSLHRQIAETLERSNPQALDSVAGVIAYHFAKGNVPERAAPYALRAGRRAASLAAWTEAIAFYEQALRVESDDAQRAAIFVALGEAYYHSGDFVRGADAFRAAIPLAQARTDLASTETAYLLLGQCILPRMRFAEVIALAQELRRTGPPELALCAEFSWATALSLEGAQLGEAERHLREAERMLAAQTGFHSQITLAAMRYQLAGVMGQQGHFTQAIALYWEALSLARADESALDLQRHILLYNSLAYYLHLAGDPAAAEYARAGLKFARERGTLTHQPYLLSTLGEIALAQNELAAAESFFSEGLSMAEQLDIPERIAGLRANLGRVAGQRSQTALAQQYLSDALARADQIHAHHLAARIRIWLAPLLPPAEAGRRLVEAREIAERSGYRGLLDQLAQIEQHSPPS